MSRSKEPSVVNDEDYRELMALAESVARAQGAGMWAEDIAASAIKKYWLHKDEVREARAWVRRTARNLAIDHFRRNPDGGLATLPGMGSQADAQLPPQMQARGHSSKVAASHQLDQALAVLDDIERSLLLGQNEGYSTRELAEKYRYTEGSVRVKLSVARRKIRSAFPESDIH